MHGTQALRCLHLIRAMEEIVSVPTTPIWGLWPKRLLFKMTVGPPVPGQKTPGPCHGGRIRVLT